MSRFHPGRLSAHARRTALGWALFLPACYETDVESTIPRNNEQGVDPRTIVAIELSNSITSDDGTATDASNVVVTGNLSARSYEGTRVLARSNQVSRGQTVEDFKAAQGSGGGLADDGAQDGAQDETKDAKDTKDGKAPAPRPPSKDTIVFLLADNTRFKSGETITVFVRHDIKSHGSPIKKNRTFSFRIEEESDGSGTLQVTATEPKPRQVPASSRPRISAVFNRAVKLEDLEKGIVLRGSQSGVHAEGEVLPARIDGSGRVLEVVRRLSLEDAFLPGETVDVAFGSTITEASTGSSGGARLSPYLLRFQVKPGRVAAAEGWNDALPLQGIPSPVKVLAADFRPSMLGTEIFVLGAERLSLFFQIEARAWTRSETPLDLSDDGREFRPVDAAVHDVNDDGIPEVVVLLGGEKENRLEVHKVTPSGEITRAQDPIDFPGGRALSLLAADLDASGKPELLVTHPSLSYVPAQSHRRKAETGSQPSRKTGTLTIFELKLVPPNPADINPADPSTLLPRPSFERLENPVAGFELAARVSAEDLHGDGKLDLLAETEGGLILYRNLGTGDTAFAFLPAGKVPGRTGAPLRPLAWVPGDFDLDGKTDLLAWDGEGALFYGDLSDGSFPEPRLIDLGPVLESRSDAVAADMNGDGFTDAALLDGEGTVHILDGGAGFPGASRTIELAGGSGPSALALADIDGDTGIDFALADLDDGGLILHLSNVEEPSVSEPTTFRFGPPVPGAGDALLVPLEGDITELFAGYSVAIDYDERLLTYKGFEVPPEFERNAQFTLCPDAALQGCPGTVSARMKYLQGTRGSPGDGIPLGTLKFQRAPVTGPTTTLVELKSFDGTGNAKFENTVTVAEGGATADVPVAVGPPLPIDLNPPPPADLIAQCTLIEREDASLRGRVTWMSPAGLTFPPSEFDIEIDVGGELAGTVPGGRSSFEFSTARVGSVRVTVTAVRKASSASVAEASCDVIGIHRPFVTCVAVSDSENRIHWSLSHSVTAFAIYRNGTRIGQASPGDTEFIDRAPSPSGGDVYEVAGLLLATEGPRGACGPVGDPDSGTTLPPRIIDAGLLPRPAAADPNTLRFRWVNGEGYDRITLTLSRLGESSPILEEVLSGGATELIHAGDESRGGVRPHQYVLSLVGWAGGRASEPASSEVLDVLVPALGPTFTCEVDGSGGAHLEWQEAWKGYSSLELRIEHRRGDDPIEAPRLIPLLPGETERTVEGLTPIGVYDFQLIAGYTDPLPDPLRPPEASLLRTCRLSFDPRVHVGTIEAGVGLRGFEIPVVADVFGSVNGFHFELEYPSFVEIDPVSGLGVDHSGARIETFSVGPGSREGRKKAVVTVTGLDTPADADGDGKADGRTVLGTLLGSIPPDFGLAGENDLTFTGMTSLNFQSLGNTPVLAEDGRLIVRSRYVVLDRVTTTAGSSEVLKLNVKGTFNAPASAPNYRLNAFTIHLKWNPNLLEIQPMSVDDQKETVVYRKGSYFLPNDAAIAVSRTTGEMKASWIGFDFENPTQAFYLRPGIDQKLLLVKFRSKVSGDQPATFAAIDFVSDPGADNPTAFFPEVDVPAEPDLEGFFGGGVAVRASQAPFSVQSITPSRGSLLGRNEAVIAGSGFPAGGRIPDDLTIRFGPAGGGSASGRDVPAADLISVEPTRIRFRVPDSTLRGSAPPSTTFDVQVRAGSQSGILAGAYSYESPALEGSDVTSGRAGGGDLMAITGRGLAPPPLTTVAFLVPGVSQPFSAEVTSASADGSRLLLLTPDLRGHESKRAAVEVMVRDVATLTLPSGFEILPDGGGSPLRLTRVSPARGTICGGLEVSLEGEGFLPGLQVRFGEDAAAAVTLLDGRNALATTPQVPEGTGAVDVTVENTDGDEAARPGAFTFEHPAPAFLRGDVSGDGFITITDVVVLADLILGRDRTLPPNLDAADANDDGGIDGGDITAIMNALFGVNRPLPPPYPPLAAGLDPTPDGLTSCP